MTIIKQGFIWLAKSSSDSRAWSLTAKAFLTNAVTILTMIFGLAHIQLHVGPEVWTQAIDAIIALIQAVMFLASAVTTVLALGRKIYKTVRGTNDVINDHPVFNQESANI